MIFQCNNVIEINDISCGSQLITSFCFIIKYLFWNKFRISSVKMLFVERIIFIIPIYIFIQSFIILGASGINIYLKYFQLLTYALTFLCLGKCAKEIDRDYLISSVNKLTIFLVAVGAVQFLVDLLRLPRDNPIKYLLYNDNFASVSYHNVDRATIRVYSTFMEPSFCAGLFAGLLFFLVETNFESIGSKKKYMLIILLGAEIILTLSPTAYGSIAIIMVLFVLKHFKNKKILCFLPIGLIGIAYGFYSGLFGKIIQTKLQSKSGAARNIWNMEALDVFSSSPIFGTGYHTNRASSIIYTIMAEQGILGLILFSALGLCVVAYLFKKNSLVSASGMIVLSNIIAGILSCPDLDMCSLWLSLYIFSLSIRMNDCSHNNHYSKRRRISCISRTEQVIE